MSLLNSNLTLPCGVVLKNRIIKSAMSENMANKNFTSNEKFNNLYRTWSEGGASVLITGNVMVDSKHLGEPNNVVIEKNNEGFIQLENWAKASKVNSNEIWMQLNHPGKQSPNFLNKTPVAPSSISFSSPLNKFFNKPLELSLIEIKDIVSRFAYASEVAKKAGFTGVQIHAAHGYLISQFLSCNHNLRNDNYGGNLENRMRFLIEIYFAIREKVGPNFPISVKLNSADFQKGGFSEEDSLLVVLELEKIGVDLIEISGGTYEAPAMLSKKASTLSREAYFLDYCEKIRKSCKVPLLLTGGFRTFNGMEQALKVSSCDAIGLARSIAINPNFPNELLEKKESISLVKPLSSGIKLIDKLFPLEIIWYSEQINLLGNKKKTNPNLSTHYVVLKSLISTGLLNLKKLRV